MRRNYKEEEEIDVDEVRSSDEDEGGEEKEAPSYECPLCGAEVEEEGYCDDCHENQELDDEY